jgi:hypothetical protein
MTTKAELACRLEDAEARAEEEEDIKASFQARAAWILLHLHAPLAQFDFDHEIEELMIDIQEWVYVAGVA